MLAPRHSAAAAPARPPFGPRGRAAGGAFVGAACAAGRAAERRAAAGRAAERRAAAVRAAAAPGAGLTFEYVELELETAGPRISVLDISPQIRAHVARLGVVEGARAPAAAAAGQPAVLAAALALAAKLAGLSGPRNPSLPSAAQKHPMRLHVQRTTPPPPPYRTRALLLTAGRPPSCPPPTGTVNVLSRHTTTALAINECEARLLDDIRQWLARMAPPNEPYLHNDLSLRRGPAGWPGGDEAWRAQEPVNAHSHLLSIMLGNSETIPITRGQLALGTWQSVLLVELDGPRRRTVGVQIVGRS